MGEPRGGRRRGRAMMAILALTVVAALLPVSAADADVAATAAAACPTDRLPAHGFDDVDAGAHADAIRCAVWWELAEGTSDDRFSPSRLVTRGQLATLLHRMLVVAGAPLPSDPSNAFSDDDGSVHEPAIDALHAIGVLGGYDDGTVRLGRAVTRGQAASMIVRALEWLLGRELPRGDDLFADDDGSVHEEALDKAAEAGLVEGYALRASNLRASKQRYVDVNGSTRRDQATSMLMRAVSLLVDAGVVELPGEGEGEGDGDGGGSGGGDTDGSTDGGSGATDGTDRGGTDGSTDSGSTDSVGTDSGSTDGGTDDGSTDSGSTDSGSTDDGSTDSGSTDGSTDGSNSDGTGDDGEEAAPRPTDGWRFVPASLLLEPNGSAVTTLLQSDADGAPTGAAPPADLQLALTTEGVVEVEPLGGGKVRVTAGESIDSVVISAQVPDAQRTATFAVTVAELAPGVVRIGDDQVVFPAPNLDPSSDPVDVSLPFHSLDGVGPFTWSEIEARFSGPDDDAADDAFAATAVRFPVVLLGVGLSDGDVITSTGGASITGRVVDPVTKEHGGEELTLVTVELIDPFEPFTSVLVDISTEDLVAIGAMPAAAVDPEKRSPLKRAEHLSLAGGRAMGAKSSTEPVPDPPEPPAEPDPGDPTPPESSENNCKADAGVGIGELKTPLQVGLVPYYRAYMAEGTTAPVMELDFGLRGTARLGVELKAQLTGTASIECVMWKWPEFTLPAAPPPVGALLTATVGQEFKLKVELKAAGGPSLEAKAGCQVSIHLRGGFRYNGLGGGLSSRNLFDPDWGCDSELKVTAADQGDAITPFSAEASIGLEVASPTAVQIGGKVVGTIAKWFGNADFAKTTVLEANVGPRLRMVWQNDATVLAAEKSDSTVQGELAGSLSLEAKPILWILEKLGANPGGAALTIAELEPPWPLFHLYRSINPPGPGDLDPGVSQPVTIEVDGSTYDSHVFVEEDDELVVTAPTAYAPSTLDTGKAGIEGLDGWIKPDGGHWQELPELEYDSTKSGPLGPTVVGTLDLSEDLCDTIGSEKRATVALLPQTKMLGLLPTSGYAGRFTILCGESRLEIGGEEDDDDTAEFSAYDLEDPDGRWATFDLAIYDHEFSHGEGAWEWDYEDTPEWLQVSTDLEDKVFGHVGAMASQMRIEIDCGDLDEKVEHTLVVKTVQPSELDEPLTDELKVTADCRDEVIEWDPDEIEESGTAVVETVGGGDAESGELDEWSIDTGSLPEGFDFDAVGGEFLNEAEWTSGGTTVLRGTFEPGASRNTTFHFRMPEEEEDDEDDGGGEDCPPVDGSEDDPTDGGDGSVDGGSGGADGGTDGCTDDGGDDGDSDGGGGCGAGTDGTDGTDGADGTDGTDEGDDGGGDDDEEEGPQFEEVMITIKSDRGDATIRVFREIKDDSEDEEDDGGDDGSTDGSSTGGGSGGGDGCTTGTDGDTDGGSDGGGGCAGCGGGGAWGDPHMVSMDGLRYDAQVIGEYVYLAPEPGEDGPRVHARHARWYEGGAPRHVTALTGLAVEADGHVVEVLIRPRSVRLDGELVSLDADGRVRVSDRLVVDIDTGKSASGELTSFYVTIHGPDLQIDLHNSGAGASGLYSTGTVQARSGSPLRGLLGTRNGDVNDDLQTRDGRSFTLSEVRQHGNELYALTDSWRVTDPDDSLFAEPLYEDFDLANFRWDDDFLDQYRDQVTAMLGDMATRCATDGDRSYTVRALALELSIGQGIGDIGDLSCAYSVSGRVTTAQSSLPVAGLPVRVEHPGFTPCDATTGSNGQYTCRVTPDLSAPAENRPTELPLELLGSVRWPDSPTGAPAGTAVALVDELAPIGQSRSIPGVDMTVDDSGVPLLALTGTVRDLAGQPAEETLVVRLLGQDAAGDPVMNQMLYLPVDASGAFARDLLLPRGVTAVDLTARLGTYQPDWQATSHALAGGRNEVAWTIVHEPVVLELTGSATTSGVAEVGDRRLRVEALDAEGDVLTTLTPRVRLAADGTFAAIVELPTSTVSAALRMEIGRYPSAWPTKVVEGLSPGHHTGTWTIALDPPVVALSGSLAVNGAPGPGTVRISYRAEDSTGGRLTSGGQQVSLDPDDGSFAVDLVLPIGSVAVDLTMEHGDISSEWSQRSVDGIVGGRNDVTWDVGVEQVHLDLSGRFEVDDEPLLSNQSISVRALDGARGTLLTTSRTVSTGEDGRYRLALQLPLDTRSVALETTLPARQKVRHEAAMAAAGTTTVVWDESVTTIPLDVEGTLLAEGEPVTDRTIMSYRAHDADGAVVYDRDVYVTPDSGGAYEITDRLPATTTWVELEVHLGDLEAGHPTLIVDPFDGAPVTWNVDFRPQHLDLTATFTVDGEPATGSHQVLVQARDGSGASIGLPSGWWLQPDEHGVVHHVFELPAGTASVRITSGVGPNREHVEHTAPVEPSGTTTVTWVADVTTKTLRVAGAARKHGGPWDGQLLLSIAAKHPSGTFSYSHQILEPDPETGAYSLEATLPGDTIEAYVTVHPGVDDDDSITHVVDTFDGSVSEWNIDFDPPVVVVTGLVVVDGNPQSGWFDVVRHITKEDGSEQSDQSEVFVEEGGTFTYEEELPTTTRQVKLQMRVGPNEELVELSSPIEAGQRVELSWDIDHVTGQTWLDMEGNDPYNEEVDVVVVAYDFEDLRDDPVFRELDRIEVEAQITHGDPGYWFAEVPLPDGTDLARVELSWRPSDGHEREVWTYGTAITPGERNHLPHWNIGTEERIVIEGTALFDPGWCPGGTTFPIEEVEVLLFDEEPLPPWEQEWVPQRDYGTTTIVPDPETGAFQISVPLSWSERDEYPHVGVRYTYREVAMGGVLSDSVVLQIDGPGTYQLDIDGACAN